MAGRGPLILVVGPSGAGKDSIIAGAAARLRTDPRIVFARRLITRPADAGGEDHVAVNSDEFARYRKTRGLLLHWTAHGLDYGLPRGLEVDLDAGCCVIANVSRTVVGEARRRLAPVTVVAVSASPAALAARLAARARENPSKVADRLSRSDALPALPQPDIVIDNDGPLDLAIDRFVELVRAVLDQPVSL